MLQILNLADFLSKVLYIIYMFEYNNVIRSTNQKMSQNVPQKVLNGSENTNQWS